MAGRTGEYTGYLNAMPKYVFSSTLEKAEWTNTTVISAGVAAAVADLKRETGKHLLFYGHGQFGQTVTDAGLVDELTLNVVPVFVENGAPFFRPGGTAQAWELVSVGPGNDPDWRR